MSHTARADLHYLNILRVLATFAVVLLHVSSASVVNSTTPGTSFGWLVGNVANSAVRWCVPVFVMVSGALLLDPSKSESVAYFYKKRARRILVPLLFWTFFYFGVRAISSGDLTQRDIIDDILRGKPYYHLWYLYMVLGLYLFTPFLRRYIAISSFRERSHLIVVILTLASSYSLVEELRWANHDSVFTMFIPYMGYYMCGYQLRLVDHTKISLKTLAVVMISCVLCIAIGTVIASRNLGIEKGLFLYNYFSLPVIILSVAVFLVAYRAYGSEMPSQGWAFHLVKQIGSATLGIYVLHPIVIRIIRKAIRECEINCISLFSIPAITVLVFCLCYMIVFVALRIPFLKRTVS